MLASVAVLMMVVGALMLLNREEEGRPNVRLERDNFLKRAGFGFATGLISGFFGRSGDLLIVPGQIAATGMPIVNLIA